MFNKLLAIAGNTFVETVRQPIFGILLWVAIGLLAVNPSIAAFSLEGGSDSKIMRDIGLSTMLLYGLLASVFSATGVITREIETFTVLTVVSKPVSRPLFLVGKFAGVCGAMAVGFYVLALALMMTARHGVMEMASDKYDWPVILLGTAAIALSVLVAGFGNFTYGWHFSSTLLAWTTGLGTLALAATLCFDKAWKPQSPLTDFGDVQLIYAMFLVFLAVILLTAFAVMFSTRLSQVMTLVFCAAIFLIGLMSDYLFGLRLSEGVVFQVLYAALPNFQYFWVADALTQNLVVSGWHVLSVLGYMLCYCAAILSLGVAMFQTREVG
jgi:ABC-2 type transport system permease protein